MAGNFVGASNERINIAGVTAINDGTLIMSFKSGTLGSAMVLISGDSGSTNDYNALYVGGNFEGSYADESIGWQCNASGAARFRMTVRNGTDFYQDSAWHRIAVRVDGSDNAFFIDGVRQSVSFGVGGVGTGTSFLPFVTRSDVARAAWAANDFTGQIDDVRLYTVGLTDNECIAITNGSGNDKVVRGIQNHWRMNEATTGSNLTTAVDLYGDQDGAGVNTPTYIESPLRII
jgi:hypothetical protein